MKSISVRQLEEALVKAFEAQEIAVNETELLALLAPNEWGASITIDIAQMAIDIERELS